MPKIKRKITTSETVKSCLDWTDSQPTILYVTDKDGKVWKMEAALEDIMDKAGLTRSEAQKHFMHLAKCVREGKVSPESLRAMLSKSKGE